MPAHRLDARRRTCAGRARGSRGRSGHRRHSSSARVRSSVTLRSRGLHRHRLEHDAAARRRARSGAPGRSREVAAHRAFMRLTAAERRDRHPGREGSRRSPTRSPQQARPRAPATARALRVVATAAMRDAPDRDALLARLQRGRGRPGRGPQRRGGGAAGVRGRDRAARAATARGVVVVVDVGGGSTELGLRHARRGRRRWWASLPVGSGALAEAHLPPTRRRAPSWPRARAARAAAFAGTRLPGGRRRLGGRRQRDVAAAPRRRRADAAGARRARWRVLTAEPARRGRARLGLHVERVRLLPAGLLLLAEAARAARLPAADRRRRAARGRRARAAGASAGRR